MFDNQHGSRYSDVELKENTNKLLDKEVLLPKLTDVKEEFEKWRRELTLCFPLYKLDEITYGGVHYDAQLGFVNPHYHRWFDTRRVMAFTARALSLDMNLRVLFKVDKLRDQMEAPSLLWGRLTAHFAKGDGINPDYILRDLQNRELMPGETVDQYVAASGELVRRFRQASGEIDE
ncbi:hypothetical protein PHMEG_00020881 [Phytophthora megakarya]|uniref:Uncharacterized protein n=1 Tax=Phytophthora megakarya TaxID=4795 RepID=A0A225VP80_9STRA|nr:hypothetical protein PHMEG_00020881 [Phytophthora megakarya]